MELPQLRTPKRLIAIQNLRNYRCGMAENQIVSVAELRQFSEILAVMGHVYAELAVSLEANGVVEIPEVGVPTAKRAFGYLGGFAGAVLKAYAKANAAGKIPKPNSAVMSQLAESEAAAKLAAQPRKHGERTEQEAQAELQEAGRAARAIIKRRRRK